MQQGKKFESSLLRVLIWKNKLFYKHGKVRNDNITLEGDYVGE